MIQLLLTTGMMATWTTERGEATERGQNLGLRFQLYLSHTVILCGGHWLEMTTRLKINSNTKKTAIELTNYPILAMISKTVSFCDTTFKDP